MSNQETFNSNRPTNPEKDNKESITRKNIFTEKSIAAAIGSLILAALTVVLAPLMLLLAFGFPILAIASLYFFFTIGGGEFLMGSLIFGVISMAMWNDKLNENK